MIRRLLDWLAPVDPNPEPSQLDRWDGAQALCMVLACSAEHTDERHGWRTCSAHAPAAPSASAGSLVMMVGA